MRRIIDTQGTIVTNGCTIRATPWYPITRQVPSRRSEYVIIGPEPEDPATLKAMKNMTRVAPGKRPKKVVKMQKVAVAPKEAARSSKYDPKNAVAAYSYNTECRENGHLIKRGKYLLFETTEGPLILTDRDGIVISNPKPYMLRALKRMNVASDDNLEKYAAKSGMPRLAQRLVRVLLGKV